MDKFSLLETVTTPQVVEICSEFGIVILDNNNSMILDGKGPEVIKKLKALEIIKEKVDSIEYLQACAAINQELDHYNEIISFTHGKQLTQEEFDLLKEVLK